MRRLLSNRVSARRFARLASGGVALGCLVLAGCGAGGEGTADGGLADGGFSDGGPADGDRADGGPSCVTTAAPRPGTVLTDRGAVTGEQRSDLGVWAYRGIPYAAPPVGDLRFRPPEPHACWPDELAATTLGPACPQPDKSGNVIGHEDCLTLNVWAPSGASDAPVLVFIHGGGNTQGTASDPLYDGAALAARTSAVVVTLDYRLGALGFLAHQSLNAESARGVSGNYGILDQIAALRWVQANIAGFGGSPQRVLLFGESAGGVDTLIHVVSPLSKGLFAAAAVESGGVEKTTLAQGITATQPVVDGVGCTDASDVAACLRSKPAEQMVGAVATSVGPLDKTGLHYKPVIDGYVLEDSSLNVIAGGRHNHVPVILGTNADETSRMVPTVSTDAEYQAAVTSLYGPTLGAMALTHYPASAYSSPRQALIALTTDVLWTCPIRRVARALASGQSEPVYRYHFGWAAPGAAGALVGATHGLELAFVFGSFGAVGNGGGTAFTPTAADLSLSETVQDYWGRLAAHGDPNGGSAPLWPRYDAATDPYLELDTAPMTASATGLATTNCDFLDTLVP
jgi:para-nitrobenzyl esterase